MLGRSGHERAACLGAFVALLIERGKPKLAKEVHLAGVGVVAGGSLMGVALVFWANRRLRKPRWLEAAAIRRRMLKTQDRVMLTAASTARSGPDGGAMGVALRVLVLVLILASLQRLALAQPAPPPDPPRANER